MKVLHLGDLHLGKSVNDFNMIDDQRYILEQVLMMIRDQGIEALLLAIVRQCGIVGQSRDHDTG